MRLRNGGIPSAGRGTDAVDGESPHGVVDPPRRVFGIHTTDLDGGWGRGTGSGPKGGGGHGTGCHDGGSIHT